jgi:multiple sugar transport system permease protein
MRWQRGLWLFFLPSFGLMVIVLLWPLGYAAYLSLFDYYLGAQEMRFVGLARATLGSSARRSISSGSTIIAGRSAAGTIATR